MAILSGSPEALKLGSRFRGVVVVVARVDEELRCADRVRERKRDFIAKAFSGTS